MNRMNLRALLLPVCLCLWPAWLWADPDPAQLAWLDRLGMVLHWDNVEGAPVQLDGTAPRYSHRHGLHVLELRPGDAVRLRLAAGAQLRIRSTDSRIGIGDVELGWSNGSGLYLSMPLQLSDDGTTLLSGASPDDTGVVRISRPATARDSISIALFTSRPADPVKAVDYRHLIGIPGRPAVRLSDRDSAGHYWPLQAGHPVSLPVQGATRLRLETRFIYPAAGDVSGQGYRIEALLDGKPWRVLAFETTLDGYDPVAVDGCYSPLGRRLNGYLEIPDGAHRLELRSNDSVYLRLLGRQLPDDYLWDGNRSLHEAVLPHSTAGAGSVRVQTEAQVLRAMLSDGPATPAGQQAVLRLLQDNSWRDGGLVGGNLMRSLARHYPEDNEVRQWSGQAWRLHTAYRDLLPAGQGKPAGQRFAWFRTPALRLGRRPLAVPEAYADTLSAMMAGGYFLELPAGAAQHFDYLLPPRAAPSRLRLGIDRSSVSVPTRLYLQLDDQPARQLLVMSQPDLTVSEWQPGRAEAALAVMNHAHAARGLTLAGPFAARKPAAPLVDVALIELTLPRDIRRVRIWQDVEQGAPVRAVLQYRAGSNYQSAGTAYQSLLQRLGPDAVYREFLAAVASVTSGDGIVRDAGSMPVDGQSAEQRIDVRDLHNQWLPLLRLLQSRYQRMAGSVPASPAIARGAALSGPAIQALQQRARQSQAAADPVAELEAWTAIRHGTTGVAQEQAALAQVAVLERVGEIYLAEQQLRGHLAGDASAAFRAQVLERLLAQYRRAGNNDARLNVLITAVMRDPNPAYLRDLAETLLALGRTHQALQVALALPVAERPRHLLLQAGYVAGWWALFDEQLAGIRDPLEHHWWAGWRAQAAGDHAQALSHWDEAGATAAVFRRQLAEGIVIRAQLGASDPALRQQAILDWERWQSRAPGRHGWNSEPQLVARHAGAETIHVTDTDQYLVAFRATPGIPATLQVHGPVTLRLSLRPLHTAASGAAIDDWVRLDDAAQQMSIPVTDNRVARGMQLIGHEHTLPGRAEIFEYHVAAGSHEILVTPERGPLLLQVATARPVLPLTVLPPLLPATVQAAGQGELGVADEPLPEPALQTRVEVVRQCTVTRLVTGAARSVSPAAQMLSQAGQGPDSGQPDIPTAGQVHVVRRDETLSEIALRYGQDYRLIAELNALDPPYFIRAGQRLRIRRPVSAGGMVDGGRAADAPVLEQMRQIVWLAEHDETQTLAMAAAAEELFARHPQVPGMQDLLRRVRRITTWEPVPAVQASAGLRVVEMPAGSPEAPVLRIRKALLPVLQPGAQLLSGFETLVFAVEQPVPGDFDIELAMADLVPAQLQPMQVRLQLDDGPERTIRLTPEQPRQSVSQRLPGGSHLLRVRIAGPVLNQYLQVVIRERGTVSGGTLASHSSRRNYHVATREEPVSVYLEGPTRVRIDEWREGQTVHRYQNLAAGWQRVQLEPGPRRQQALFRIHRLTVRQPSTQVPARLPAWTGLAPLLPVASLPAASSQARRETVDRFALGGQEDGTWSLASALVRRRNVDEDSAGDDRPETFAELSASHRYFAPDWQSYFRTDLLTRVRTEGGTTLGVREWIDIRRPDWPFDIALDGSLYAQQPDKDTGSEWAASIRAALSRQFEMTPRTAHRPVISVFQRWLSLDEPLQLHPERVDQDLFTEYKNDHRRGLGLGDTLSYRPWLDTLWQASLGLVSNENLNVFDPDHVTVELGARQLLQNWQASADYQLRHYLPDRDRSRHVTQQRYQLSLDWLGWRSDKQGWQARMQLVWDDASNEFSGRLSLAWLHSNARFYRDFRPAELAFRSLRVRQMQEQRFAISTGGLHDR